MTGPEPLEREGLRLALVLWNGGIGGAENFTADLARAMRACGADPTVVFVQDGLPLTRRLEQFGVAYDALEFRRGRDVLRAPRRFARAVSKHGPDVALLVEHGFLAATLRAGGYRAPIVGVEHGPVLELPMLGRLERVRRKADLLSGAKVCSVVVAVSECVAQEVGALRPRRCVVCIANGVDVERFTPPRDTTGSSSEFGTVVVGCASRLVPGKGLEDVIRALQHSPLHGVRLRVAGEGPSASDLKDLVRSVGLQERVDFLGSVHDMPDFWRSVDIAVVPSNPIVEAFGMAAIEAMACARPVIATNRGGLSSIVVDGVTGHLVPPGDIPALAAALYAYVADPVKRLRHGISGRRRCEEHYAIERAAERYLALCSDLVRDTGFRTRSASAPA